MNQPLLIVLLGPTASGKTTLAAHIAHRISGEIISADSRQVYRDLNIGTGKDLDEYQVEGKPIPYHLIDICDPGEEYNLSRYQEDFEGAFSKVVGQGKKPILCGGSGLYLEAVLEQYQLTSVPEDLFLRKEVSRCTNDELVERIKSYQFPEYFTPDLSTRKRLVRSIEIGEYLSRKGSIPDPTQPMFNPVIFGVKLSREIRRKKITNRLRHRLDNGLIEEVQGLIKNGISTERLRYFGLEYKFVTDYLEGELSQDQLFEKLNVAIHQFAKRQMTWFRRMERRGHNIHWIDGQLPLDIKIREIVDKLCG